MTSLYGFTFVTNMPTSLLPTPENKIFFLFSRQAAGRVNPRLTDAGVQPVAISAQAVFSLFHSGKHRLPCSGRETGSPDVRDTLLALTVPVPLAPRRIGTFPTALVWNRVF